VKQDTYWQDYFRNQFGNYGNLPNYQDRQQAEARRLQEQTIQDLQTQAAGNMNSRAQQELQGQNRMGQQSQYALASGQRGGDMRAANQMAGRVGAQLPGQANVLKLQEQQAAQAMLAQMLAQQQGQDITQANDQSQMALRGQALQDAHNQFMMGQGAAQELGATQLQHDTNLMQAGYDLESDDISKDWFNKGMGAGAGAIGTLSNFDWNSGPKYRQVDGKDSIVPDWDK
jgi:hypothetical protein